jgi:hypothetical protein
VLLYSIVGNLYHSGAAASIGNLHETQSLIQLATCPTHKKSGATSFEIAPLSINNR